MVLSTQCLYTVLQKPKQRCNCNHILFDCEGAFLTETQSLRAKKNCFFFLMDGRFHSSKRFSKTSLALISGDFVGRL